MTRAGGDSFGPHMAEFVLGHMLAHERHFYAWNIAQRERRWRPSDPTYSYRPLHGLTVGVMGCSGAIGRHIARTCAFFGMAVRGLSSHASKAQHADDDGAVQWFHTSPAAGNGGPSVVPAAFLHGLDYLVNALPSTAATRLMLGSDADVDVLRPCRDSAAAFPQTVLINVGRGDVISERALLRALLGSDYAALLSAPLPSALPIPSDDAFLKAAVLDVFMVEPLPSSHAFYGLSPPLLTVSPHVAGISSAAKEVLKLSTTQHRAPPPAPLYSTVSPSVRCQAIVDVFLDNLRRFTSGQPLLHEVDKERGY